MAAGRVLVHAGEGYFGQWCFRWTVYRGGGALFTDRALLCAASVLGDTRNPVRVLLVDCAAE